MSAQQAPARPAPRHDVQGQAPREMPTTAPLDERAWAEAYRKENKLSKAAMAEHINYSRTVYSRFEEGTYDGDPDPVRAAIRALRDRVEGPGGLSVVVGFRETSTAATVFDAYALAQAGELVILIGESGEGKSEALKEIARRASRNGHVTPVYFECTVFTSAFALVSALGKAVGCDRRPNPDSLLRDIAEKLKRTPRPLLLDEVHYAHEKALEAVRQIRDQSGVGIVLAGTSTFAGLGFGQLGKSDLLQDLMDHRPHLEQIISRATIWKVPGLKPAEVEAIAHDVLGACTPDGLERLQQRAGHSMRRLVRMVQQLRKTRSRPCDERAVDAAWAAMYGGGR